MKRGLQSAAAIFGALLLATLFDGRALAEVCDKVAGNAWLPEHGPRVLLGFSYIGAFATFAALLVAAWFGGEIVVALSSALVMLPLTALSVFDPHFAHDVVKAAQIEGCRSLVADWIGLLLSGLVLVASMYLLYARRHGAAAPPPT